MQDNLYLENYGSYGYYEETHNWQFLDGNHSTRYLVFSSEHGLLLWQGFFNLYLLLFCDKTGFRKKIRQLCIGLFSDVIQNE